jgi:hypothetical protein
MLTRPKGQEKRIVLPYRNGTATTGNMDMSSIDDRITFTSNSAGSGSVSGREREREIETEREREGSQSNSEKSEILSLGSKDMKKAMKSVIDNSIGDILCTAHRDSRRDLESLERTISRKGSTDLPEENNKNGYSNSVFTRNKNGDDGIYAINGKFGPTSRVLISSIKHLNLNSNLNLNPGASSLEDGRESISGKGEKEGGEQNGRSNSNSNNNTNININIKSNNNNSNSDTKHNNSSSNGNGNSNSKSSKVLDDTEPSDLKKAIYGTTTASSSTSTLTSTSTSLSTNTPKILPHTSPPATFEREALALQLELAQMQKALQDRMHRYQVLTSFNPDKIQK